MPLQLPIQHTNPICRRGAERPWSLFTSPLCIYNGDLPRHSETLWSSRSPSCGTLEGAKRNIQLGLNINIQFFTLESLYIVIFNTASLHYQTSRLGTLTMFHMKTVAISKVSRTANVVSWSENDFNHHWVQGLVFKKFYTKRFKVNATTSCC